MTDNREVGGNQQYDEEDEDPMFASLTPSQAAEREDIIKALGQRCNALMRYDGKDPALVASALLWCGISMYAQGAPELTREALMHVCGTTFDEVKVYLEAIKQAEERKKGEPT